MCVNLCESNMICEFCVHCLVCSTMFVIWKDNISGLIFAFDFCWMHSFVCACCFTIVFKFCNFLRFIKHTCTHTFVSLWPKAIFDNYSFVGCSTTAHKINYSIWLRSLSISLSHMMCASNVYHHRPLSINASKLHTNCQFFALALSLSLSLSSIFFTPNWYHCIHCNGLIKIFVHSRSKGGKCLHNTRKQYPKLKWDDVRRSYFNIENVHAKQEIETDKKKPCEP